MPSQPHSEAQPPYFGANRNEQPEIDIEEADEHSLEPRSNLISRMKKNDLGRFYK